MCRTFTEPIYFIILGWILYVSQMESESQLSAQGPLCSVLKHANQQDKGHQIWVRSRRCSCLVTWFCYQLIAKPGNKTAAVSWPDPYTHRHCRVCCHEIIVTVNGSSYKLKRLFFGGGFLRKNIPYFSWILFIIRSVLLCQMSSIINHFTQQLQKGQNMDKIPWMIIL